MMKRRFKDVLEDDVMSTDIPDCALILEVDGGVGP